MGEAEPQQTEETASPKTAGTETEPEWRVRMWHVLGDHTPQGLRVAEILVVDNLGDRTWIGAVGESGERVTTSFVLPPGATDVALERGFQNACCTTITPQRLINHLPIEPGTTQFKFRYFLPAVDGVVPLSMTAPAPVDHLMVVMPAELDIDGTEQLVYMGTEPAGDRSVRAYMGAGLEAGERAAIDVRLPSQAVTVAADGGGSATAVRIVAAVGGAVLVLAAAVVLLRRGPPAQTPAETPTDARSGAP
jgi:hypothetical protein